MTWFQIPFGPKIFIFMSVIGKDCGDGDEDDGQAASLQKGCKQGGKDSV